jgi:hypothetical protein
LALPIAAWADAITIVNQNGGLLVSTSGIVSHQSQLVQYNTFIAAPNHAIGTVDYATGALISGSIRYGGVFAGGGKFDVFGTGPWAKSLVGSFCPSPCKNPVTLFTGSFSGPVTWTLTSPPGAALTYTLTGNIVGTLYNGRIVTGTTVQSIFSSNAQLTQGIGHIKIGTTGLGVPEPGTLGLLGTGLVGIAGMFRRKLIGS